MRASFAPGTWWLPPSSEPIQIAETSAESGEKNVYTFVPGNLTELLRSFDLLPVLPEINALQSAMRGKSKEYIAIAEKAGQTVSNLVHVPIGADGAIAITGTAGSISAMGPCFISPAA